jgi:hypothetical protein
MTWYEYVVLWTWVLVLTPFTIVLVSVLWLWAIDKLARAIGVNALVLRWTYTTEGRAWVRKTLSHWLPWNRENT